MAKVRKRIGEKALISLLLAVLSFLALTTAAYAWIGVSRVPFITNMSLSVLTENGILVTSDKDGLPDEEGWATYFDVSEYFSDMVPIRPATYWPDEEGNLFHMITYDITGRTSGVKPLTAENFNQKFADNPDYSRAFQNQVEGGYMCYLDLWMKTNNVSADIYLMDGETDEEGQIIGGTYCIGEPSWDEEQLIHVNSGYGLECSVRYGFEVQKTDMNGNPIGDPEFTIYEPNCDIHPIADDGYIATENVVGGELIGTDRLITQKASVWTETDPVLADSVKYTVGEFVNNPQLLRIEKLGMVRVRIYVWIEGQDYDCKAYAAANEVNLRANFSFGVHEQEQINTDIGRRDVSELPTKAQDETTEE